MMNLVRMTSEIRIVTWNCYKAVEIGHVRHLFLDYFKSKLVIDEEQLDEFPLPLDVSINRPISSFTHDHPFDFKVNVYTYFFYPHQMPRCRDETPQSR